MAAKTGWLLRLRSHRQCRRHLGRQSRQCQRITTTNKGNTITLTTNLTSTEEERLAAAARYAGLAPDALLKSLVSRLPLLPGVSVTAEAPEAEASSASAPMGRGAHAAVVQAAQGSLIHVGASVEDLHAQRHSDKAWEQAPEPEH